MTINEYINQETVKALLDDRQDLCKGLLVAAQLACGSRCPQGHGKDQIERGPDGEIFCEACGEYYETLDAAVEHLYDLGYNVVGL